MLSEIFEPISFDEQRIYLYCKRMLPKLWMDDDGRSGRMLIENKTASS
jgi:hypothetical protein